MSSKGVGGGIVVARVWGIHLLRQFEKLQGQGKLEVAESGLNSLAIHEAGDAASSGTCGKVESGLRGDQLPI